MQAIIKIISVEHNHIADVLEKLDEQFSIFSKGETLRFELINDGIDFLRINLQSENDTGELLLYKKLKKGNKKLFPAIEKLEKSNVELKKKIADFSAIINDITLDAFIPRSYVNDQARSFILSYKEYIKQQDDILLQITKNSLIKKDWAEIENTAFEDSESYFTKLHTRDRSSLYNNIMAS